MTTIMDKLDRISFPLPFTKHTSIKSNTPIEWLNHTSKTDKGKPISSKIKDIRLPLFSGEQFAFLFKLYKI
jgi:hypothetical protein